ncbi:hypothetical protein BTO32_03550 [Marinobacter lutaoensis]|jgi:hypothetical protein|uniref:C4-dicarboxylate ABC transporter substrate-binding protein n=1 Tax=Marinobacter lutaoensis TaxID=135739 RepID=A0A1V2DVT4_9GAMM|nr:TAXI family TRAP transporter solute-binding subunit [Marinobacter lutaoensis]ONF44823.1 hypothetical protein BTO32_03550 [Marinobacter lutaoensis]
MKIRTFLKSVAFVGLSAALTLGSVAQADEYRKIATASTTGAFYPIGGVIASILNDEMEGYNFTAEATGGSVENARLIGSGESDIGFFGGDTLWNATHGTGPFEGRPHIPLAPIAKIYSMPLHVVALKGSGIHTVADLDGKTVAVGAPGSGTGSKAKVVLEGAGLIYGKNLEPRYLNFREGSDALVDGNVDAVVISVGMPSGNVQEIAATHDIVLASIGEKNLKRMVDAASYLEPFVIPAGTYQGVDEDVQTISTSTYLAVREDMDENEVYEMCMALFDRNLDRFKNSHSALKSTPVSEYPKGILPLHPGAKRCYQDMGLLPK